MYPKFIRVDGELLPLNTSYKAALHAFKVINDEDIGDVERAMALMQILLGTIIMDQHSEKVVELLVRYLQRGKTSSEVKELKNLTGDEPDDIDYEQDIGLIVASFMSDYHIDLSDSKNDAMHWWRFVDLLNGTSPDSALGRVRQIRTMDISEYKDPKMRSEILKAKRLVAIKAKQTEEERTAEEEFMRKLGL